MLCCNDMVMTTTNRKTVLNKFESNRTKLKTNEIKDLFGWWMEKYGL